MIHRGFRFLVVALLVGSPASMAADGPFFEERVHGYATGVKVGSRNWIFGLYR